MIYKPGDIASFDIQTYNQSSELANPSALSIAVFRNDVLDATISPAVTVLETGVREATFTIPLTYAKGDRVRASVDATCDARRGVKTMFRATLDSKRVGDLNDAPAPEGSGIPQQDLDELLRAAALVQAPLVPSLAPPSLEAGTIAIRRGDTFATTFQLPASAAGYARLWMTFKKDRRLPDAKATLQFVAGEGLAILNAAPTGVQATKGALTLANDGLTLSLALDETITAQLSKVNSAAAWDVQMLKNNTITTLAEGKWQILEDVTQATS